MVVAPSQTTSACLYIRIMQIRLKHANCDHSYAHHFTGVVAAAPVSLVSGRVAAGRKALQVINNHSSREQQLQAWESRLAAKEMELNGKFSAGKCCQYCGNPV